MNAYKTTPPTVTLNQRTVLVKVDSVMDVRGVSADIVYDMADGAGLQWVWNVAVDPAGEIRDLRFWSREVIAPETTRKLELDGVIGLVLGDRKNFHAGDVCHLLRLRRPTLLNLRQQLRGESKPCGGTIFPLAGLRSFLKSRWLGLEASKSPTGVLAGINAARKMPDAACPHARRGEPALKRQSNSSKTTQA